MYLTVVSIRFRDFVMSKGIGVVEFRVVRRTCFRLLSSDFAEYVDRYSSDESVCP